MRERGWVGVANIIHYQNSNSNISRTTASRKSQVSAQSIFENLLDFDARKLMTKKVTTRRQKEPLQVKTSAVKEI